MGKSRITNRLFSIEVLYAGAGLFLDESKRVKMVVRATRKDVGTAVMSAYGFEEGTQEILLQKDKPNAVTMMLSSDVDFSSASVHVLDASTLVELNSIKNIPVDLSI
jgi:hypothetical protein